ncbi:hypothetical protein A6E12_05515 [Aliivibrio fischeri]|uniref:hypothetical protein n=1 Tax=Aliivibrio fischeri TaxID=668 RepID=UPI00080E6075|nr:hypothetical protein [Aliivibrio fischeri]OCH20165.1 hypothetical protein A6E12_05515 [Aliivibrio fischeri]
MSAYIQFPKETFNKTAPIAYGEDEQEVMIDQVIYDYILKYSKDSAEAQGLLSLLVSENKDFIEKARESSEIKESRADYIVNLMSSALLNVSPVPLDAHQTVEINFDNLTFQCGKTVSQCFSIPAFIMSMMSQNDVQEVIESELIHIDAKDFNFELFNSYIRGILFSRLFENKITADNWV